MRRQDISDLEARLTHAGYGVEVVSYGALHAPPRVRLSNGLSAQMCDGDYIVCLWHGTDPIRSKYSFEFDRVSNAMGLLPAIAEAEKHLPETRERMLGECRDVLGECLLAFEGWTNRPEVVHSTEPVDGALAVSMQGMRFSAWVDGMRFTSTHLVLNAYRRQWNDAGGERDLTRAYFPINDGRFDLVAAPTSIDALSVEGTASVNGQDAWFYHHLARRTSRDGKQFWSTNDISNLSDDLAVDEKAELSNALSLTLDFHLGLHFDVFANREVKKREIILNSRALDTAAVEGPGRSERIRQERHARMNLDHALAMQRERRHFPQDDRTLEEMMTRSRTLGNLQLVHSREVEREL